MTEKTVDKLTYLDCWTSVATSLFAQALAGEPVFSDSLPKPMSAGSFGFEATVEGEESGRCSVLLDGTLAEAALLGEGVEAKTGWSELLREVADAAAGELLAKTGRKCHVAVFKPIEAESKLSRAFQLKSGERSWSVQVFSNVRVPKPSIQEKTEQSGASPARTASSGATSSEPAEGRSEAHASAKPVIGSQPPSGGSSSAARGRAEEAMDSRAKLSPGLALLLDVELEASLRFGAREMPLGEILDLGPGDVVQLDRHVSDPVELIVGDKIVARGEVVLVDGNFGLRVTEVAEPQSRLESIRCLF